MKGQLVYFLSWTLHFLFRPALPEACTTGTAAECREADFVPGYNLAGEGFDIVKMERKGAYVIDVNSWKRKDRTCTLCKNPFLENVAQKLPLSVVDWRALPKCSSKISSSIHQSSESLVNSSTSSIENNWQLDLKINTVKASGNLLLAGSHSRLAEYSMEKTKSDKFSFTSHETSCRFYSYRVVDEPRLHREFGRTVKKLPRNYDGQSKPLYYKLIDTYGTHYVKKVLLGGKVKSITSIKTCKTALDGLTVNDVKDCLDVEASATVSDKAEGAAKAHHCQELKKRSSNKQSFHDSFNDRQTEITGGKAMSADLLFSTTSDPSAYQEWMESLKTTPDMISYALEPLHNLIRFKGPVRNNLKKAVVHYILEKGLQQSCSGKCATGSRSNLGDSCSCVCHSGAGIDSMCCPTQRGLAKLTVKVIKGENLWGDYHGQTDGFVKVILGNRVERTSVVPENNNPSWNHYFDFGSVTLTMATELKFEVWDEDSGWDDDLLGSCSRKLEKGSQENLCALNHGNLFFSYTLECGPSLGGPACGEYTSTPVSAELMNSFVSRNSRRISPEMLASMGVVFPILSPFPSNTSMRESVNEEAPPI
ncbi:perforin-1-like isoform X2 [Polyodon spathula]|nr:perforin-1-like isoform X2 [Polyodon spathula]XP_041094638.1 perforin-1-like isoform X2 [Polyodon spathula]